LTILRRRPGFRAAFAGFDPAVLARWGLPEVEVLMGDAGIVRNRRKIEAVLSNARLLDREAVDLDALLWSFAPPPRPPGHAPGAGEVPASTPASVAMARDLRARGIVFVGPVTAYALMQATGMVDDHVRGCWRAV